MSLLDSSVLISIERNDIAAAGYVEQAMRRSINLHTTAPVVAQVWRGDPRQANLARFLRGVTVHDLSDADGRQVGELLGKTGTSDVVDAHLVIVARRLGLDILTGDVGDLRPLADAALGNRPQVRAWP